ALALLIFMGLISSGDSIMAVIMLVLFLVIAFIFDLEIHDQEEFMEISEGQNGSAKLNEYSEEFSEKINA
ncbi:MAG: hypothetical protein KDD94_10655, partial [Calditrichaeota bacterium]|nr:hypothetical protein [Calditrichota bacterium]